MTCDQARELVALAASGDVTLAEGNSLELHMAGCLECRAEAKAYEALCGQLGGMRDESVRDHAYAAVRARVIGEIQDQRRPRWVAAWGGYGAGFAAVIACGLILTVALHRQSPLLTPVPEPARVEIAAIQDTAPEPPMPPLHRRIRRSVHRATVPESGEPLVVHMFTDDPDVVIYWIADARPKVLKKEIIQ